MPSAPPPGDPAPSDGALPLRAVASAGERGLGFYVHVPFCAVRCGYCDFNTYTAAELGPDGGPPGASRESYAEAAVAEVRLARKVLGEVDRPVDTVFFGGGTPTLLPPDDLVRVLDAIRDEFGLAPGAEVTTESNPDSVDAGRPRAAPRRRVQPDLVRHAVVGAAVLRSSTGPTTPRACRAAVGGARAAGFDQVSLDLIYGTPGESLDDWRASLERALACGPDHVSAYALIVEDGTALARQVRRGELPAPDDDDLADKYLLADELLAAAGSTGTRSPTGPATRPPAAGTTSSTGRAATGGASGRARTRTSAVCAGGTSGTPPPTPPGSRRGVSPAEGREVLDDETRRVERILLETRLVEGMPVEVLDDAGRSWLPDLRAHGLLDGDSDRVRLTRTGRLLADAVVRDLVG